MSYNTDSNYKEIKESLLNKRSKSDRDYIIASKGDNQSTSEGIIISNKELSAAEAYNFSKNHEYPYVCDRNKCEIYRYGQSDIFETDKKAYYVHKIIYIFDQYIEKLETYDKNKIFEDILKGNIKINKVAIIIKKDKESLPEIRMCYKKSKGNLIYIPYILSISNYRVGKEYEYKIPSSEPKSSDVATVKNKYSTLEVINPGSCGNGIDISHIATIKSIMKSTGSSMGDCLGIFASEDDTKENQKADEGYASRADGTIDLAFKESEYYDCTATVEYGASKIEKTGSEAYSIFNGIFNKNEIGIQNKDSMSITTNANETWKKGYKIFTLKFTSPIDIEDGIIKRSSTNWSTVTIVFTSKYSIKKHSVCSSDKGNLANIIKNLINKNNQPLLTFYDISNGKASKDENSSNDEDTVSETDVSNFINKWRCKHSGDEKTSSSDKTEQYDIEKYYKLFSGMTPYVKIGFKNSKGDYDYIDSIKYPYIKSLNIKDNGVKTANIVLFDKEFGSYTDSNLSMSLETLIKQSINNKVYTATSTANTNSTLTEKSEYYSSDSTSVGDGYLIFKEPQQGANNCANIKIKFGYADYNKSCSELSTEEKNSYKYSDKRKDMWWDVSAVKGINDVLIPTRYIENETIKVNTDGKEKITSNTSGDGIDRQDQIENTKDQSTARSTETEYMIIGYTSKITNGGIEYNITAIESVYADLMSWRFLQRYAEINSYPEGVLYTLMHIFNEDNEGNNIKSSKLKILFQADDEEKDYTDIENKLVQEFDVSNLSEDEISELNIQGSDSYENVVLYDGDEFVNNAMKKISISLGGQSALKNYVSLSKDTTSLYKNVSDLITEFCAACPPKKIVRKTDKNLKIQDENGNDITPIKSVSCPLKWKAFKGINSKDETTYIVLYYRKPKKAKIVRLYTYGVMNPKNSCVKEVNIQNSNEFAMLSSVSIFDGKKFSNRTKYGKSEETVGGEKWANIVTENGKLAQEYDAAYSNSVYDGTITIMGDPFYSFDTYMQPCTYPIQLKILLPSSETSKQSENSAEKGEYRRDVVGTNSIHESSGTYMVKEIEHDISSRGFTTTLKIMSYPNIEDDVLYKQQ